MERMNKMSTKSDKISTIDKELLELLNWKNGQMQPAVVMQLRLVNLPVWNEKQYSRSSMHFARHLKSIL